MKKIFYFFALLLCFAACDNEEKIVTPETIQQEMVLIGLQMDEIRSECENFDKEKAPELFAGKKWLIAYDVECDDSGSIIRALWCAEGSFIGMPGYVVESIEICSDSDPNKNWEYNSTSQIITMDNREYHILALGDDVLMWEYSYYDAAGKKRNYRQIYKFEKLLETSEQ